MSNPKRRQDILAWREAERRQAELTTARHYRASIGLIGIGLRELRIAVLSSFDVTEVWELRRDPASETLRLYLARSEQPDLEQVVGYLTVEAAPDVLQDLLRRFHAIGAPVAVPPRPDIGVADGVRLEVSFHSLTSSCYVQWVQEHAPAPWSGLNELVDEALALFRRAPQTPV